MKRLTLSREKIITVITAMALAYPDCTITSQMREDEICNGVYELVPVTAEGACLEEARTLISNTGTYHQGALNMLAKLVRETLGEEA